MALYIITCESGTFIVRAKNGHHAQALLGERGTVVRLNEDGDEGVIDIRPSDPEPPPRVQRFLDD